jgi:hypothetical protein
MKLGSFTEKDLNYLMTFERKILRKIFGPIKEEMDDRD